MRLSLNEIVVRDFLEIDIKKKVEWINDPRNNTFLHYDIPLSIEKTLNWFHNRNLNNRIDCTIECAGVAVGLIGLLNIDLSNLKAEYYITIGDVSVKRKGVATTASKLILDYAFNTLKMNKVYLNVDADNVAACKLYEKLGFKCEGFFEKDILHNGVFIDRKRYAYFKEDFV